MKKPSEREAIRRISEIIGEVTGSSPSIATIPQGKFAQPDVIVDTGRLRFIVEYKSSGNTEQVANAIFQLKKYAHRSGRKVVLLVAVPYMGSTGKRLCREANVSWLDLSGNAQILATGLRFVIEGKPNLFKQRGRPSSAFAPKSSRIARWMLIHPNLSFSQKQLSTSTGISEGFTSRIVARLIQDDLLRRENNGHLRIKDPDMLFNAWMESYSFSKHSITRGHITARSGEMLLRRLMDELFSKNIEHAATGLGAAWVYSRFAAFRIATVYLAEEPPDKLIKDLSFKKEPRGSNIWLVVPNDEGVFHGLKNVDGIRCVHPIQVYLDLQEHPERAVEAAESIRKEFLRWRKDG